MLKTLNFPSILAENEKTYLQYLEGLVGSVDRDSQILVTRRAAGISVRISPSFPRYFEPILIMIKRFHSSLDMRVEFSKSMKAGYTIFFNINF